MVTSSPYSPVTVDTAHMQSPQDFIFKACSTSMLPPLSLTSCFYKSRTTPDASLALPYALRQCQASQQPRKLSWSIRFCFLKLLLACRQKLGSAVGYSKAALLSVSMIQKGLPRRTLLQRCLVTNDPHAAPAVCNIRHVQSVLMNTLLIVLQTGFAYGHDCLY